jgi:calcineurin-like phosphoesterase family protein
MSEGRVYPGGETTKEAKKRQKKVIKDTNKTFARMEREKKDKFLCHCPQCMEDRQREIETVGLGSLNI